MRIRNMDVGTNDKISEKYVLYKYLKLRYF